MEQARYWMWSKRKHSLSSHFQASANPLSGDSWEEQAFAQDASGPLGGCIWPPRSYSCSFCRREFRSAQALGGHMNVHRRDRARLKQSSVPHNDQILHHFHQNHHNPILINPSTPVDVQYPSQICTMVYKPNPDTDRVVFASPARVSPPTTQENHKEKAFVPNFSSPIIDQERSMKSSIYAPPSWSNLVADRYFQVSDLNDEERNSKFIGSNSRAKDDYVTADLSVSLNLVVRRSLPTSPGEKEEALSCKRQRTDSSIPLQSFPKSCSSSDDRRPEEVQLKLSTSSSIDEIDLELRLGDLPKVK